MTWFKVDDGFWSNPKVIDLSDGAVALWVKAGSYCCQHLTDGVIKDNFLRFLGDRESAEELVEKGLWKTVRNGYKFHDWEEYQETRDTVKKRREQAKERMRERRKFAKSSQNVRANTRRTTSERSQEVRDVFADPDPTRPDHDLSNDKSNPPKPPKGQTGPTQPEAFQRFWDTYGKKVDKPASLRAWDKAIKKTEADQIIDAATQFITRQRTNGKHPQYTPNPATWLNREGWNDDLPPVLAPKTESQGYTIEDWDWPTDSPVPYVEAEVVPLRGIGQ